MPNPITRTVEELYEHLGPAYIEIDQDVTRLHAYWKIVNQLFGTEEAVSVLNRAASFATRTIQDSLLDSVVLRITKLTDPAESQGGRVRNLSLEHLISILPSDAGEDLKSQLRARLENIQRITEDLRLRRNKQVAHRDRAYAIEPEELLPGVSVNSVEEALELIRAFMHQIQLHYGLGGTLYGLVELGRDGEHLLTYLRWSQRFVQMHKDASRGRLTPDELMEEIKKRL